MGANKMGDVLIAGAGPVGLTAAVELVRRGYSPMIVDSETAPAHLPRAIGINARTLEILEPSGITSELLSRSQRINTAVVRNMKRTLFKLNLNDNGHRYNFLIGLPQPVTERVLIKWLNDNGHDVRWNTTLQTVVADGDQIRCALSTANGVEDVTPGVLIGADGAHSTVRKSLNLDFSSHFETIKYSLADVELDDWPFPQDAAVLTLLDNAAVSYVPHADGHGRFVSNQPGILGYLPEDAKIRKIHWQTDFNVNYRQVEHYHRGSIFLAGDAAHIHSPVTGRGMNLGMEDAATLAWLIAQGETANYTALRHPAGEHVLKFTQRISRASLKRNPLSSFARFALVPMALCVPAIRRFGARAWTGLDTPTPDWLNTPRS